MSNVILTLAHVTTMLVCWLGVITSNVGLPLVSEETTEVALIQGNPVRATVVVAGGVRRPAVLKTAMEAVAAPQHSAGVGGDRTVPIRSLAGTSTGLGRVSGGGGQVDSHPGMFEDEFRIKIPGEKTEHVIPGSCVRSVELTVMDIVGAYANSLNVSANDLQLLDMDLTQVFTDIRREFSVECFREEVLAEAADFVFPEEVWSRDTNAYREADSSLETLITRMQASKAHDRYNAERCDAMFKDDPEYDRLLSLARDGVIIDPPDDLILQSEPEAPRKLQRQLDLAYKKHAFKVWGKRNGVILQQDALSDEDRRRIHFNPPHITAKPPGGSRFLMDCSNSEAGQVLNTPAVKVKVMERYSAVQHSSIQLILTLWYAYAESHKVPLSRCRMFKDDFSGAFTQMNVEPASAYLLAMAIGGGFILVYFVGLFGWLGFPMAYAVFSRAFERKFRRELEIPVVFYLDDIIALSLAERAASDQWHIELECEKAIGSKAVSYEKQVLPCLSCEVLGWLIDLITETLRPSEKGIRKLVFAFWLVATGEEYPLVVYQLLASLAEHYSLGLPGMDSFTYPLHNMVAKFHGNNYWKKKPTSAARLSIEVWRVVAMLSLQKNKLMCSPLRNLVSAVDPSESRTWVFTDSSPTGLGIGVYSHEGTLLAYMGYQFPFCAEGSEFQCAREYFAYMFGFIFLEWALGKVDCSRQAAWVNDNKAAISWAEGQKCNSMTAQYAFMAVTWQHLSSQFTFSKIEHQKGVLMGDIDGLSRGYPHSLDPSKEYVMSDARKQRLDSLFLLLDPSVVRDLVDHHTAFDAVITMTRNLTRCDE